MASSQYIRKWNLYYFCGIQNDKNLPKYLSNPTGLFTIIFQTLTMFLARAVAFIRWESHWLRLTVTFFSCDNTSRTSSLSQSDHYFVDGSFLGRLNKEVTEDKVGMSSLPRHVFVNRGYTGNISWSTVFTTTLCITFTIRTWRSSKYSRAFHTD